VSVPADTRPVHVILPQRGWPRPDLRELWRYRDLVYFLARRDIAVRYRQTALGAAWAIVQPVAFAAVFGVFLTLIGRVPTEGIPYPVFVLTGMTVWLFVSASLSLTASSTLSSSSLVSKVYFPRLTVPLAAIIPPIVDFLIAFAVLLAAMAVYGVAPSLHIVALPAVFALAVGIALGAGLWLAAIAARFRDVQHVVPFLVQIGLFLSPVLYPLTLVPDRWQTLYALNPLVGVLEGFRWAVLGTQSPGALLLIPLAVSVVLLVSGLMVFSREETRFADEL
jgi:lipopolysaccharide transport system permease protein